VSLEIFMFFNWFSGHETCESHHPDGRQKGKFNFSNFFVDKKFDLVLGIANVAANVCGNVCNSR